MLLDWAMSIGYYMKTELIDFWPDQKVCVTGLARYEIL